MVFTGVRTHVVAVEQAVVQNATKLEAPVVVVTGASRGIGKAIALTLGKAGCKVSSLVICSYISRNSIKSIWHVLIIFM